jgi:hypothetical protein
MHKDPNLRKRDALVIPGGLLALFSLIGMLYVALVRGDQGTCEDASLIVFAGACRSALLVLAIPFIVGLALLAVGVLKFRSRATCRIGHGSWAHFGLAVLITLVVLPVIGYLAAPSLVGEDAAITSGDVDYPVTTLLAGIAGVGFVGLVPFVALYVARNQANPCCHEKGCFEPCFCDEPIAPTDAEPAAAPLSAEEESLPMGMPSTPVAQPVLTETSSQWDEAPAEPTSQEWEVVPDEPTPETRKLAATSAPALAARPTDPAAPPQDAMAIAAKWAAEDEEAARELAAAGSDPPAEARRKRLANQKKAPAKKSSKK